MKQIEGAASKLAPIENGAAYPLSVFAQRTGLGKAALRTARQNGLRVIAVGNRRFVRGVDFIAFLESLLADAGVG